MAVQTIEPQVVLMLEVECARLTRDQVAFRDAWAGQGLDKRLCEQLIELLEEHPQRPAREFEPLVQRLLMDLRFCGENGDVVFDPQFRRKIDGQAKMLVLAMQRVRERICGRGQCEVPMFG